MSNGSDVVVIGGGQAGLAMSHELGRTGIDHVVLERDRVGAMWAGLWESFRINTPSWSVRLPGMPYDGDEPDGFMSRTEIVSLLERYAAFCSAPIREGVEVTSLRRIDGGFRLETSEGLLTARSVVVASGAYQAPFHPKGAEGLPPGVMAIDTRSYRDPASLPDGTVLIVGSGQSGCQIAEDLVDAGREVILSCGKAPWAPRRIGSHDVVWWAIETGFLDGTVDTLPSPGARFAANITASGVDGGRDLSARSLRAKGVTLVGRFAGCDDGGGIRFGDDLADSIAWGDARYLDLVKDVDALCAERGMDRPALPDPEPFDPRAPGSVDVDGIGAVIFSGGFRPDYARWVHVPDAFDDMGFPVQFDGASAVAPGLFFVGVHFLRTRMSSLLYGVGEDAAVVAQGVARHLG